LIVTTPQEVSLATIRKEVKKKKNTKQTNKNKKQTNKQTIKQKNSWIFVRK